MEIESVQTSQPRSLPLSDSTKSNALADLLQSVVIAIFISIVIYLFLATPNQVSGDSMLPNFHNGELLLTNKVSQWFGQTDFGRQLGLDYVRGDVVVFHKPGGTKDFIKRIIGLPGETVMIEDGDVFINGSRISEAYIPSEIRTINGSFMVEGKERLIPEYHYFVMGDNRLNSQDSRYVEVGFVNRNWLKGKVLLRYWPPVDFNLIGAGDINIESL